MTEWEYQTLYIRAPTLETMQALLNDAGGDGWALVTVLRSPSNPNHYRALFKRPKPH